MYMSDSVSDVLYTEGAPQSHGGGGMACIYTYSCFTMYRLCVGDSSIIAPDATIVRQS